MKNSRSLILAIVAAGMFAVVASVPAVGAKRGMYDNPKEPELTPRLRVGKMNFEAHCAGCHGKTARGTDKGPTFISPVYHPGHHADGAFVLAAKRGARRHHWHFGDMKPVEGVTDAQILTIIEYVRAVQKANGVF